VEAAGLGGCAGAAWDTWEGALLIATGVAEAELLVGRCRCRQHSRRRLILIVFEGKAKTDRGERGRAWRVTQLELAEQDAASTLQSGFDPYSVFQRRPVVLKNGIV
jgi:hypothetical protein